ncbi:MAG: DUF1634 domain-containing protein [Metallibacterium sp.]
MAFDDQLNQPGLAVHSPAADAALEEKIRKVEIAISLVLRVGVIVSVLVILAGLVMMFIHHPRALDAGSSYRVLVAPNADFPHSLGQLRQSLAAGAGRGVVVLGVLLLILTPILRVAVSVLSFVYEKDPPMVIATLFVLSVLIFSFFLAQI